MKQNNAITAERVRILYEKVFASISTALIIAFICVYIFRDYIAWSILAAWLGFITIINLFRYWLLFDYNKNKQNTPYHDKYENRFTYATGVLGIGWAFFIVMGLSTPSFDHRLYSLLLLVGLIAIAAPVFSSSIRTFYFYTAPSALISIPLLISRGGDDAALGVSAIVFIAMMTLANRDMYKTLNDALVLRFQTQKLAENLEQVQHDKLTTEQRLLLHREQSPIGIIEWNTDFECIDWNPAAERIFGFSKNEVLGQHITDQILPENARPEVNKIWQELLTDKGGAYSLNENYTKDGRTILCEWHNTPLKDYNDKIIGITSLVDDVTDRLKDEENLRHSQKMDAIGQLTGGIAHDFNNMLGVILGFSELIKNHVKNDDQKINQYTDAIINAGERAKKLTSNLLEFSRKAPSAAEITCINKLLTSMKHLLERTLTPRIRLELKLEDNIGPIWIDKARLEDAILNLSINAMHAMPDIGTLTLSTSNIHFKDSDTRNFEIIPGDYVSLSVSDTGIGMSKDIQQKMFEPFFTTKGHDGTGLGLSQVYGFVEQSCGKIQVFSEPGHGTRIIIYFPLYKGTQAAKSEENSTDSITIPSGQETILIVDDEVALLDLTETILTNYGYTVLRAKNAEIALKILNKESVDLLLTDIIMPGMNGYQLAAEVEKLYPAIKIQMLSGFSDEGKIRIINDALYQQRLHKPISSDKLLRRIRELLDR